MFNIDFHKLDGTSFKFYGVDNNAFKLNTVVFEAIEDPSDGYRSFYKCVIVHFDDRYIFFDKPLATVKIVFDNTGDGWSLIDTKDSHKWLEVGTDHSDNYYPFFYFRYTPKTK